MQKKPDVEGNASQVQKHKKQLIDLMDKVVVEMQGLSYANYRKTIDEEMAENDKYELQKEKEKALLSDIQRITAEHKRLVNEYTKQEEED